MGEDILDEIKIGLILRLRALGVADDPAEKMIESFVSEMRENYGGARYQIKRGYRRYSPRVIRKVKREYTGRNETILRARYGLSRSSFYRLIRK